MCVVQMKAIIGYRCGLRKGAESMGEEIEGFCHSNSITTLQDAVTKLHKVKKEN